MRLARIAIASWYYLSAGVALCVAICCVFFSFIGALGLMLLSSTTLSVLLIAAGGIISIPKPIAGVWTSASGALCCALALLAGLYQTISAFSAAQRPVPFEVRWFYFLFLIAMIWHLLAAMVRRAMLNRDQNVGESPSG
jgi:hypothetical protein